MNSQEQGLYVKINLKSVLQTVAFLLLMLPHFKPGYFGELDFLDYFYNVLRVLSAGLTFAVFVLIRPKLSSALATLFFLNFALFSSTLINTKASLYDYFRDNVLQFAVYVLYYMLAKYPKKVISILMLISEVLTYINLYTIIILPDGLYKSGLLGYYHNWFLGYKNQFFPFFLCFFTVAFIYAKYKHDLIRPAVLIIAMMISLVLAKSSTSIFVFSLFLILVLFSLKKNTKLLNPFILALINLVLVLLVAFLQTNVLFSYIIEVVLHRDLTLTGRTLIWSKVFELIGKRPILGWGVMSLEQNIQLIGIRESTSAHNLFFNYLLTGGAISFSLFIAFNFMIINRLYCYRSTYVGKILTLSLFIYNIACITEAYTNPLIYIVYAFADNIAYFVSTEKEIQVMGQIKKKKSYIVLRR